MKELLFILLLSSFSLIIKAQPANCGFKQPAIRIDFGSGTIKDVNTVALFNYERVGSSCPSDGHYTYTNFTSDCFRGDWLTLAEDHTPGDAAGNMLLVNSSYDTGPFFETTITGLKSNTTYEFALWLMNVCKISDKCPFPLLPNLTIQLQTQGGKSLAQFGTGEIVRREVPHWTRYAALFTTPASTTALTLIMINNKPGGCGNDFALDDISFRECVKPTTVETVPEKNIITKKQPIVKTAPKKTTTVPVKRPSSSSQIEKLQKKPTENSNLVLKSRQQIFPPPPPVLTTRTNTLVKKFETAAGEIRIDLYDNGEIDGDTVSIYHNNKLLMAHARLSQKPTTIRIDLDASQPYHELVMVAENLGAIPPNTSLMIISAGTKRYQVFISSNEQKNAKVIFDLKE